MSSKWSLPLRFAGIEPQLLRSLLVYMLLELTRTMKKNYTPAIN
jgi:hypothetical protein